MQWKSDLYTSHAGSTENKDDNMSFSFYQSPYTVTDYAVRVGILSISSSRAERTLLLLDYYFHVIRSVNVSPTWRRVAYRIASWDWIDPYPWWWYWIKMPFSGSQTKWIAPRAYYMTNGFFLSLCAKSLFYDYCRHPFLWIQVFDGSILHCLLLNF